MKKKYFAPEFMSISADSDDVIMTSGMPENEVNEGSDDVGDGSIFG